MLYKIPKPTVSRDSSHFVGLDNQGATCYLNSLIQAMYMTPELRFGLYAINPGDLGFHLLNEFNQDRDEASKIGIVEVNESMLEQLKEFGVEDEVARNGLISVKNSGVMEAFEYIGSHQEELKTIVNSTVNDSKKRKKVKPRLIPLELQKLFTRLQLIDQKSISTQGKIILKHLNNKIFNM